MVSSTVVSSSPLTVGFSNGSFSSSGRTTDYHHNSVGWLHKAIRDESWDDVPELVMEQPQLLIKANARGWTALHVAASSRPYGYWWKWLLKQQQEQTPSLNNIGVSTNDMGQTVLDLYFRFWLYPLPWQRQSLQEEATRLRSAMELLLQGKNDEELLLVRTRIMESTTCDEDVESTPSSDRDRVVLFWTNLFLLKEATSTQNVLQWLAAAHWCPGLVAKMALALFPEQLYERPLPLHVWCETPKIQTVEASSSSHGQHDDPQSHSLRLSSNLQFSRASAAAVVSTSSCRIEDEETSGRSNIMLHVLCEAFPQAAEMSIVQNDDLLLPPLAIALQQGKTWHEVEPLFHAYPHAIQELPLFCWPTLCNFYLTDHQAEWTAKRQGRLSAIWPYLTKADKLRAMDQSRQMLEWKQLTTIYELLRRNPAALLQAVVDDVRL